MRSTIDYCGVIERVEKHHVYVKIVPQSACSGCQAKSLCATAGGKEQIIKVSNDLEVLFDINEPVTLSGDRSMGSRAVGLAFVIPLILVVAVIAVTNYLQWEESASALTGLSLLLPYYATLYILRQKLNKNFTFTIKKLTQHDI
jgi:sigma-E factor negative regulatory protein RseC